MTNITTALIIIIITSNSVPSFNGIGRIIAERPRIKITLKILEPIAFPTAISFSPFIPATIEVTIGSSKFTVNVTLEKADGGLD